MDARRFKADFEDALKVMWAFNDVFAAGPASWRESKLPFGKGRIKNALVYINAAIRTEETQTAIDRLFPRAAADLYLSDQFAAGAYAQLTSLPRFLPDAEADLRARVEQRMGYSIGDDGLYTQVSPEDLKRRLERMLSDPAAAQEHFQWSEVEKRTFAESEAYVKEAKAFTAF